VEHGASTRLPTNELASEHRSTNSFSNVLKDVLRIPFKQLHSFIYSYFQQGKSNAPFVSVRVLVRGPHQKKIAFDEFSYFNCYLLRVGVKTLMKLRGQILIGESLTSGDLPKEIALKLVVDVIYNQKTAKV